MATIRTFLLRASPFTHVVAEQPSGTAGTLAPRRVCFRLNRSSNGVGSYAKIPAAHRMRRRSSPLAARSVADPLRELPSSEVSPAMPRQAEETAGPPSVTDLEANNGASPESSEMVGSVLGAVALITGSSVGAGVLALPDVSAPAGFIPTTAGLLGCWALLSLEAMVMAEVNVAVGTEGGQRAYRPTTLTQAIEATLGSSGAAFSTGIYLLTSYTLLVAYLCKGNEVVSSYAMSMIAGLDQLPPQTCGVVFGALMCLMLNSINTDGIDKLNRLMTALLLGTFLYIVGGGASAADFSTLAETQDWGSLEQALPILFLSLVYHDLVPLICLYLGGDLKRIRTALAIGGSVPLAMFLTWNAVALSMVPAGESGFVDPLVLLSQQNLPMMDVAISGFGLLAISTSFIGTFLGLSSYLSIQLPSVAAWMQPNSSASEAPKAEDDTDAWQLPATVLTLAPPLAVYWLNSDGFLPAAQFAGAYGMTTLYALVPPLMAWKLLSNADKPSEEHSPEAQPSLPHPLTTFTGAGGRMVLASMTAAAVGMESFKAAVDSGLSIGELFAGGGIVNAVGTTWSVAIPDMANSANLL